MPHSGCSVLHGVNPNKKKTNYFNVKFYFLNACLNSVEHIYYFPLHKIKRAYASFQVSKCFVFSLIRLTKHFGM